MKTNAMRILDTLGIHYEIREYEVDPEDLSAEKVAAAIGLPPEQVYKMVYARRLSRQRPAAIRGSSRSG
jgi:Cys-tRNA(Pro)/Cys-tRNA(Cys) deacylase